MPNFIALKRCKGKYIAICEDLIVDRWIQTSKQVDLLSQKLMLIIPFVGLIIKY
jgi:hypothetical protein